MSVCVRACNKWAKKKKKGEKKIPGEAFDFHLPPSLPLLHQVYAAILLSTRHPHIARVLLKANPILKHLLNSRIFEQNFKTEKKAKSLNI